MSINCLVATEGMFADATSQPWFNPEETDEQRFMPESQAASHCAATEGHTTGPTSTQTAPRCASCRGMNQCKKRYDVTAKHLLKTTGMQLYGRYCTTCARKMAKQRKAGIVPDTTTAYSGPSDVPGLAMQQAPKRQMTAMGHPMNANGEVVSESADFLWLVNNNYLACSDKTERPSQNAIEGPSFGESLADQQQRKDRKRKSPEPSDSLQNPLADSFTTAGICNTSDIIRSSRCSMTSGDFQQALEGGVFHICMEELHGPRDSLAPEMAPRPMVCA